MFVRTWSRWLAAWGGLVLAASNIGCQAGVRTPSPDAARSLAANTDEADLPSLAFIARAQAHFHPTKFHGFPEQVAEDFHRCMSDADSYASESSSLPNRGRSETARCEVAQIVESLYEQCGSALSTAAAPTDLRLFNDTELALLYSADHDPSSEMRAKADSLRETRKRAFEQERRTLLESVRAMRESHPTCGAPWPSEMESALDPTHRASAVAR